MIRRFALVLLCLASITTPVLAEQQPVAELEIIKFQFLPQEITVKVGDTLRWTNKEKRQYHSVWFEQSGDPEPPYLFPGDSYQRTFDEVGSFPYRCGPHPKMTGIVHVVD